MIILLLLTGKIVFHFFNFLVIFLFHKVYLKTFHFQLDLTEWKVCRFFIQTNMAAANYTNCSIFEQRGGTRLNVSGCSDWFG